MQVKNMALGFLPADRNRLPCFDKVEIFYLATSQKQP
jgi:hypothetical protein